MVETRHAEELHELAKRLHARCTQEMDMAQWYYLGRRRRVGYVQGLGEAVDEIQDLCEKWLAEIEREVRDDPD